MSESERHAYNKKAKEARGEISEAFHTAMAAESYEKKRKLADSRANKHKIESQEPADASNAQHRRPQSVMLWYQTPNKDVALCTPCTVLATEKYCKDRPLNVLALRTHSIIHTLIFLPSPPSRPQALANRYLFPKLGLPTRVLTSFL
jgi:hypothetical protein